MSVGARILKWQIFRAYAGPQYGPPVTVKIYSDPFTGGVTVDGFIRRQVWESTWAEIHGGNGTLDGDLYSVLSVYIQSSASFSKWFMMERSLMTFDLSVIPAGSQIQSARFCGYGANKGDTPGWQPQIAVYESYPLADNDLVLADYTRLYTTPLSNIIDYNDFVLGDFNYFILNAQGLALLVPGQICRLGLREAKYDAPFNPPLWVTQKWAFMQVYAAGYTPASGRSYLEVTYRPLL